MTATVTGWSTTSIPTSATGTRWTPAAPLAASRSCGSGTAGTASTSSSAGRSSRAERTCLRVDRRVQRSPFPVRERPGRPGIHVVGHDDGLRLGGDPSGPRADRLGRPDRRSAVPGSATGDEDRLVLQRELAPEIDRDPDDHEIDRGAEGLAHPPVPAFLQVGQVDRVVDVPVVIDVAPPDADLELLHGGRAYGAGGKAEESRRPRAIARGLRSERGAPPSRSVTRRGWFGARCCAFVTARACPRSRWSGDGRSRRRPPLGTTATTS